MLVDLQRNFSFSNMSNAVKQKNIIIGCTGSVASIKVPLLVESLNKAGFYSIKIVPTEKAMHFFDCKQIQAEVFTDKEEWEFWQKRDDPVLHVELSKWADVLVIAPLDANTMAKISAGICDNLLTCLVRCWHVNKPLIFCPAMNTKMYEHPITASQISKLKEWGYIEIPVIEKKLMCGDKGLGAMAEVDTIIKVIITHVNQGSC